MRELVTGILGLALGLFGGAAVIVEIFFKTDESKQIVITPEKAFNILSDASCLYRSGDYSSREKGRCTGFGIFIKTEERVAAGRSS